MNLASIASNPPNVHTTIGETIAYVEELHDHAAAAHEPWLAIVARLLRAACPDPASPIIAVPVVRADKVELVNFTLDPLVPSAPEPLTQRFRLATQGSDPGLDALAILIEVLKGLEPEERGACLAYITSRFMGEAP